MDAGSMRIGRRLVLAFGLGLICAAFPLTREAWALLLAPAGREEAGDRVALVLGVNEWPQGAGLPRLYGAVPDARSVTERLRSVGYDIVEMTSDGPKGLRPTKRGIMDQFDAKVPRGAGNEKGPGTIASLLKNNPRTLLIYASLHGVSHKGDAYLMPMDARLAQPDAGGLTLKTILDLMAGTPADIPYKILIVDACKVGADNFSKGFVEALQRIGGNWLILTACSEGEVAMEVAAGEVRGQAASWDVKETKEPHGLFTLQMLLSTYGQVRGDKIVVSADRDRDGRISFAEAFHYAKEEIQKEGYAQTPVMFGHLESAKELFGYAVDPHFELLSGFERDTVLDTPEADGRWEPGLAKDYPDAPGALAVKRSATRASEGAWSAELTFEGRDAVFLVEPNPPLDLRDYAALLLDIYSEKRVSVGVSVSTGEAWLWHEVRPRLLSKGWNRVVLDLKAPVFRVGGRGGEYTNHLVNPDAAPRIAVKIYPGRLGPGSVYLDHVGLIRAPKEKDRN